MFDFHIHSAVSYDSKTPAADYVKAAEKAGLREICFTDHMDYIWAPTQEKLTFTDREYREAYEGLSSTKVKIRKGFEFGLLPDNRAQLAIDIARYDYDFVLGSVHMVDGIDRYFDESYWQGCTQEDGERRYFETVLSCVENHRDFDVLGHLTYVSKMPSNPQRRIISYGWYRLRRVEHNQPHSRYFGPFGPCCPCLASARRCPPHPKEVQNLRLWGAGSFAGAVFR